MIKLLTSNVGRLRIAGFLEGSSLLILIFVGMPTKYALGNPGLTRFMGPVHGALFLVFVLNALSVSIEQQWSFKRITWKVLLACMIPFGTFYIDHTILRKIKS